MSKKAAKISGRHALESLLYVALLAKTVSFQVAKELCVKRIIGIALENIGIQVYNNAPLKRSIY